MRRIFVSRQEGIFWIPGHFPEYISPKENLPENFLPESNLHPEWSFPRKLISRMYHLTKGFVLKVTMEYQYWIPKDV